MTEVGSAFLPGVKWQLRETDHSPRSSTEVKKVGSVFSVPHINNPVPRINNLVFN